MKICLTGENPVQIEDASIDPMVRTIRAYEQLDAPEPPHDALTSVIESSDAHETDIAPVLARALGRAMQVRSLEIRQRAAAKHCARGLHLMTPENTKPGIGTRGDQCRACHNEAQRNRRRTVAA